MDSNLECATFHPSPTEDRQLLAEQFSGTAPPPPTPEEHAFDQASVTSIPDSQSLGSLLAELLNQGRLPACIHADGCAFKISEIQEEVPDAASAVECAQVPAALTLLDVKGVIAQEIAVLQIFLQRQLNEMSKNFSSGINNVSEIRTLHLEIKQLQNYSDLFIRNQEKLLYATFNKIHSNLKHLEHLHSIDAGRIIALEKKILQSMVTENKILDCVVRLEEKLGKVDAGSIDKPKALNISAFQDAEDKTIDGASPEDLERIASQRKEVVGPSFDSDRCVELSASGLLPPRERLETLNKDRVGESKAPLVMTRGPDGEEYNVAASMVRLNLDPL
ncbi:hypothetical protein B2J93_6357 [Marssonina coronariae]|uniref:Uncharacterized protein n=1 Tax=Diplocarpon coronariae TaxID=2795749 RepID=A0A218YYA2_9HELO|nr:hypothetical protein B2J93_6357 [Marssonina coronariae]